MCVCVDEENYLSSFSTSTSTSLTSFLINSTLFYSVLPLITSFLFQPSPPLPHHLFYSLFLFLPLSFKTLPLSLTVSLSFSLTNSLPLPLPLSRSLLPSLSLSSPFDQHIDLPPSRTLFFSEYRHKDKRDMKLTNKQTTIELKMQFNCN